MCLNSYECPASIVEFLRLSGDFPSDALGDDTNVDTAGIRSLVSTFTINYNLVGSVSAYDALSEQAVLDMLIEYV